MAMAADSSPNNSPRSPISRADGVAAAVNSPQNHRRSLPAPWAQVVRGGEPESTSVSTPRSPSTSPPFSVPEQSSSPDCSSQKPFVENSISETVAETSDNTNGNAGRAKKPAWNKPVNGVVVEAGPVMGGAVAWPALSESTRPTPKSSTDSSKPIPEVSSSVSQGPIIPQLPQKQAITNANTHSNANHTAPVRQRSMKHRGGSSSFAGSGPGGPTQSGFSRAMAPPPPPLPPPFPGFDMPYVNNLVPALEPPVRGARPVGGFPSQQHAANDHASHRNHGRKGNFGGRPRGDGSYHNNHSNHGGRRDQDRRDVHLAPQYVHPPGGFIPPQPPGPGPFLTAPPVRPYAGPMGFDMSAPFMYVPTLTPESFRGMPIISQPPPPHILFPLGDPNLRHALVKQIEYYFSDDNLVKDHFLRSKMDEEGWVPIELIANFPRVMHFTNDIRYILECLRPSVVVEVQDEKIRRRDGWKRWIRSSGQFAGASGSSSIPAALTTGAVTTSLQHASLNESAINRSSATDATDALVEVAAGGLPDESTSQSKLPQEGNAEESSSNQA